MYVTVIQDISNCAKDHLPLHRTQPKLVVAARILSGIVSDTLIDSPPREVRCAVKVRLPSALSRNLNRPPFLLTFRLPGFWNRGAPENREAAQPQCLLGSERESDKVRILCGFLKNEELGLGDGQPLRFE